MWKSKDKINSYSAKKMKEKWDRWRSIGACGRCGTPCAPFSLCKRHRLYQAKASRRYHKRHKEIILEKKRKKDAARAAQIKARPQTEKAQIQVG